MAITKPVESQIVSEREQTWRINFELRPPSVQFYREIVSLDADDKPVGQPRQNYTAINRSLDDIEDEIVELGDGSELTFGDITEALSLFGDRWAKEDADNPPAIRMPPLP